MDEDGKRIFGVLLLVFIVTLGITFENINLKTENTQLKDYNYELLTARAQCSTLGFCIGDKIEPTDDAKRWNITIGGVVRKIEGNVLTIDTGTLGNENWQAVNEMWVRHERQVSECYFRLSNGACITLDEIGFIKKTSRNAVCTQLNCTNQTEYARGITMLIIEGNLQNKKIILMET